jgi:preprotein translocase subunit SecA
MDYLREGIHLRGFAQIDPLVAYKNEAFELFSDLMGTIWSDFARMVFNVPVEVEEAGGAADIVPEQPRSAPGSSTATGRITYTGGNGQAQPSALAAAAAAGAAPGGAALADEEDAAPPIPVEQRKLSPDEQIGRNDPCWCGSGQKYKKCHGR